MGTKGVNVQDTHVLMGTNRCKCPGHPCHCVDKRVKNTEFNTLKTKVQNLEKKIPNVSTLIYINQHNIKKQTLEKTTGDVDKIIPHASGLVTTTVLNKKISEVENKIPDTSSLMTTNLLTTKISEVEKKIPDHAKYKYIS